MIARVNFYKLSDSSRLEGIVQPSRPRASVVIQRKSGTRWLTVAKGRTTASGEFSIRVALRPGIYRGLATLGSRLHARSHAVASRRVGMRKHFAVLVLGAALAAPGSGLASPGRISVGLEPEADAATVAAQVASATGGTQIPGLAPLRALVVSVPDVESALPAAKGVQGVAFAEPVLANRTISFAPNDPLAVPEHQWYLGAIRAFDFWVASRRLHRFRRSSWP